MQQLLGVGAIAGAIGVCVVEGAAYMKMSDFVTNYGAGFGGVGNVSIGWGIYVGAVGGVLAGLGGLLALSAKPGAAGSPAGSKTLMPIIGVIVVIALLGGAIVAWPQLSNQINGSKSSPSVVIVTPKPTVAPTGKPTKTPSAKPSTAPTPAGSFYTSGYSTPELAINQFVHDQGYSYGGDCDTASSGSDYCSSHVSDGSSGSVYAVGGLGSEAEVWVLMRKISGKWYMVDVAKATASPPWD
jgi:hypothetical protein